jgi:hypothetical protein
MKMTLFGCCTYQLRTKVLEDATYILLRTLVMVFMLNIACSGGTQEPYSPQCTNVARKVPL